MKDKYMPKLYTDNEIKDRIGVYQIRNLINNKIYIGSSKNLYNRKCHHFADLKGNRHINTKLQNSFNKYGKENFVFEVIEFTDELNQFIVEQYWIKKLNTVKYGYNINPNALNPPDSRKENNPMYGKKHKLESIFKMSKNRKGKKIFGENPRAVKVICLETLNIYDSYKRVAVELNRDMSSIKKNCDGEYKNPKLNFMRLEDYLKVCKLDNGVCM